MSRIRIAIALLILLTVHQAACYGQARTARGTARGTARPNIVFLLADDMGYADLGCFGSKAIHSPNLDRLATDGIRLTHCYAASPNCSPARAGILTGRSPYRVGMYDFARFKPLHIPRDETTVAELLKSAGYQTMFAGKWHCSGDFQSGKQPYPGEHGFDHWFAHSWPNKIKAKSSTAQPVNGTDWLPTFCAAAGVSMTTIGKKVDGTNVLPALTDMKPIARETPMLWWLWHARGGYEVAMRDGDYKMVATMLPQANPGSISDAKQPRDWTIMQFIKKAELGRFEMFNLSIDEPETTNLAMKEPERFAAMKAKMIALHAEIRAEGPVYQLGRKKRSK